MPSFYPDPVFGWSFYAVLVGFLAVATYIDVRTLRIPKQLTIPMLGLGLVISVVRGVWMGTVLEGSDETVWLFASSPALGALDGLLCALAGFATGFAIGVVMWILGVLGGGDVKLMAALGAWVGPKQMLLLTLATTIVFLLIGVYLMVRKAFRRGIQKTVFGLKAGARATNLKKTPAGAQRRSQLLAYSIPVAVATALLLPIMVVRDQMKPAPPKNSQPGEQASAQP